MTFSIALVIQVAVVALIAIWAWRSAQPRRRLASAGWAALLSGVTVSFVTPFVAAGLAAMNVGPPAGLGISAAEAVRLAGSHATAGANARLLGTRAVRRSDEQESPDGWLWIVYFQREGCGGAEAIRLDYLSGSFDGQGCPANAPLSAAPRPTPRPSPITASPSPAGSAIGAPCDVTGLAARTQEQGATGAAVIDAVLRVFGMTLDGRSNNPFSLVGASKHVGTR